AALELGGRALRSEADLEAPRQEAERGARLVADEPVEVAPAPRAELGPLHTVELEPPAAAKRVVEAALEEAQRCLDCLGRDPVGAELLRQSAVEGEQRLVGDLAAEQRVGLGVDGL